MFRIPYNNIIYPQKKQTIEALWRLEKVILDTLDFKQVNERIVNSLLTELDYLKLGYKIIVLALIDKNTDTLKRVSISQTEDAKKALEASPLPFPKIDIPMSATDNLCIKVVNQKRMLSTTYWPEMLTPPFTEEQAKNVQNLVGVKTSIVYPIVAKNEVLGVMIFSLGKEEKEIGEDERDLLRGFTDIVGLAVQNASLYSSLESTLEKLSQASQQLAQKNKNLELLQKMGTIINTTLDLKEMSKKIVDTVSWELGFDGALISLIDYDKRVLVPTAYSNTPLIEKAVKLLPDAFDTYVTALDDTKSISVNAIREKRKVLTNSLSEAFAPVVPAVIATAMQKMIRIKGVVICPVFAKDKALGVLMLGVHSNVEDLSRSELEILDAFIEEVGIALDNAYLYEETKRVNKQLSETNQKLVVLDKMKDEFVSIASHELRTPMTAINGYVWMVLSGKGGPVTDKQKYYLDRVAQSTQRLINLVNDMLSVSRIEGGRIQINPKDFDVVDLVKSVHEELQVKVDEKNLQLKLEVEESALSIFADPDKVREIMTNLIGNALKFTESGSITSRIEKKDGVVEISVTDTGKGIPKEDKARLFKKFSRIENTLSTVAQTSGTGLGLYICKRYLDLMKGEIGVDSELGKGSRFWFRLPLSQG